MLSCMVMPSSSVVTFWYTSSPLTRPQQAEVDKQTFAEDKVSGLLATAAHVGLLMFSCLRPQWILFSVLEEL